MNELDTRAERFLESIRAEGEAACAAIRTETDAEIDRQLDEARQAVYAFTQICVATGNIDFICAGEVVQHRRRSSTSIFSCSVSHPG